MASSDKRRRKQDPPRSHEASEDSPVKEIFTSSVRSTPVGAALNRRLRTGSHGSKAVVRADVGLNGWQVDEHPLDDDEPMNGYAASSSSTIRPRKNGHQRGRTGSPPSHPLASSSIISRGFDQDHPDPVHSGQSTPHSNSSSSGSWVAVSNPNGYSGSRIASQGKDRQVDEARTVIVHKVSPIDSLAGVALKYGVDLAELKRANKLWSSDSIHLRKVLYIPVDAQKWGSKHSVALDNLIDLDEPADQTESSTTPNSKAASSPSKSSSASRRSSNDMDQHDNKPAISVRRIPASQLSFFPPPSTPPSARKPSNGAAALSQSPLKFESFPRTGDGNLFSTMPRLGVSSNLDPFGPPLLSTNSTSRALPSLFSVFSMPSPRVSFSSEGDTEASDELHLELDNADGWTKGRRSASSRGGTQRPQLPQGSPPIMAGLLPSLKDAAPRTIRTQQPTPSPLMELPVRNMRS